MKKNNKIWIGLIAIIFTISACDSLFDVDSERFASPDDLLLDSPDKVVYSMNGLFLELNKLAESYVLFGELRGDLMDVTEYASDNIKAINNFDITADHPLVNARDYYSIINNCNFIIANIDTSVVQHAEKVLYREFAATKAIRAWTYMQLALNFGSAKYYTDPLLTVVDAMGDIPEYTIEELANVLIPDLTPWRDIEAPDGYSIGEDVYTNKLYFPISFVLGELYLWKKDYENAAREFYKLIYDNEYIINENDRSYYLVENNAFTDETPRNFWRGIFDYDEEEIITLIAGSIENGEGSLLDTLIYYNWEIKPSDFAVTNWSSQIYYHNATVFQEGDLRGEYGSYYDYSQFLFSDNVDKIIYKYGSLLSLNTKAAVIYRVGLLYLRYAEAVNRAGKPNLAFATIKNGLSSSTMGIDTIVPPREKYMGYSEAGHGVFYDYANFQDVNFDDNLGVRERGCGYTHLATKHTIGELADEPLVTIDDSIEFVEDLILNELALETAFEGNRFYDLMRIAKRRNNPSFLADKVAAKHVDNSEAIRTLLLDENNWYLPKE